jgi:capsular polysaccharide transport system permease protein
MILSEKPFTYALKENTRVITALVIRSAVTRFGKSRMGFIWILAEPLAYVGIYILMHTAVKEHVPFGDNALLFVLTGIFGFRMTRGIAGKTERGIASNLPMLAYPLVRPLDTLVATFLLESTIWLMICAMFMAALSLVLDRPVIVYPGEFTECMMAVLYFAFSFATFNAAIAAIIPRYTVFMKMINMPLMFASGIFFVPAEMPPQVQAVIWWNPYLHCVEWFRISTYLDYNALLSKSYLLGLSTVFLTVALVIERVFRGKIIST